MTLYPYKPRRGMTLVEMLVAMALAVFMMAILSEAFVTGLKALGNLKALADMDAQLRSVASILRRDLSARHFEGNRKLSELTVSGKPMPRINNLGNVSYGAVAEDLLKRQMADYRLTPPKLGYFYLNELVDVGTGPASLLRYEGSEVVSGSINRHSYRDLDTMRFTVQLNGNDAKDFFYGKVPAGSVLDTIGNFPSRYDSPTANGIYTSQWAEVIYDCKFNTGKFNTGTVTNPSQPGSYMLLRKQMLLIPDHYDNEFTTFAGRNSPYAVGMLPAQFFQLHDISATTGGGGWFFNSPADVQFASRRPSPGVNNGDLLLTNLVSFNIQVWDPFAYKDVQSSAAAVPPRPIDGRGAFVDLGETAVVPGVNPYPTAGSVAGDMLIPVFAASVGAPYTNFEFDTGCARLDNPLVGGGTLTPRVPSHNYPFNAIQIQIRVYEPKSQQTRQLTIIQDM